MHIIDALLGEHAVFYALFDELDQVADAAADVDAVARAVAPVATALISHARLEDELLFPALREVLGEGSLVEIMTKEHEDIDRTLRAVLRATDLGAATGDLLHALDLVREHFEKEETVLFLEARDALTAEQSEELGQRWATRRGVSLDG